MADLTQEGCQFLLDHEVAEFNTNSKDLIRLKALIDGLEPGNIDVLCIYKFTLPYSNGCVAMDGKRCKNQILP